MAESLETQGLQPLRAGAAQQPVPDPGRGCSGRRPGGPNRARDSGGSRAVENIPPHGDTLTHRGKGEKNGKLQIQTSRHVAGVADERS